MRLRMGVGSPGGVDVDAVGYLDKGGSSMKRLLLFGLPLALGAALLAALAGGWASSRASALPTPRPTVNDYVQLTTSETPPTQAQCSSVGRRCFTPASTRNSYNLSPLYAAGLTGQRRHDRDRRRLRERHDRPRPARLRHAVRAAARCAARRASRARPGMPTFSQLALQGSPATKAPPREEQRPGLEDKSAWALEVSLDVETAHSIAPGANILLVTTPTAETLGVQGFPQMMSAEDYVVKNHLAQVISQSFASAEEAFKSTKSLLNLRGAFVDAAANGVTVLGSSGDGGTANGTKQSLVGNNPNNDLIPFPTVEWPASDPLVTGVGGTYLCTDPNTGVGRGQRRPAGELPGPGAEGDRLDRLGRRLQPRLRAARLPEHRCRQAARRSHGQRGVPDVGLQASARTGALVYLTLPPDGQSGLICGSSPCSTGWYDIGGTSL